MTSRQWRLYTLVGCLEIAVNTLDGVDDRLSAELSHTRAQSRQAMPPNPNPTPPLSGSPLHPKSVLHRILGSLSIFSLLMTIPQVLSIWINHQAAGVSALSWSAYLITAVVWFLYGLQKADKNIYLPCIGWILLDSAVLVGAIVYGK